MNMYLEINQVDLMKLIQILKSLNPDFLHLMNRDLIYNTKLTGSMGLSTVMMRYKDCIVVSKNHCDTVMFRISYDKHASLNPI